MNTQANSDLMISEPDKIELYRLIIWRRALLLEIKGIRFKNSVNKGICNSLGLPLRTRRNFTLVILNQKIEEFKNVQRSELNQS